MDAELEAAAIRANLAALRFELAGVRLLLALRHNPYWHLQPRVPAGNPDGGQWTVSGPLTDGPARVQLAAVLPLLSLIARAAPAAYRAFRLVTRRIAPLLRRLPDGWSGDQPEPISARLARAGVGTIWSRQDWPSAAFGPNWSTLRITSSTCRTRFIAGSALR